MRSQLAPIFAMITACATLACGDGSGEGSSDDGLSGAGSATGIGGTSAGGSGGGVETCASYDEVRAQVFAPTCFGCHGPGSGNPVSFDTQAAAESRAVQIAGAVASGYMPLGGPRLSDELVDLVERWASCVP